MIRIDIVSDIICPWCYIGKKRLEDAIKEFSDAKVQIFWHPFQLNPEMPEKGIDRKVYLRKKFGKDSYPVNLLDSLVDAGKSVGISFQFNAMLWIPNTVKSHCLLNYAQELSVQDIVVESLFQKYFVDGEDIGKDEVLVDIGAEAKIKEKFVLQEILDKEKQDLIRRQDNNVRKLGISGVPSFFINKKYLIQGAQNPSTFLEIFNKLKYKNI